MQSYFTMNEDKKNKILDYFFKKKVKVFFREQETFLRKYEFDNDNVELSIENSTVYCFEWDNKRVRKEDLIAL